MPKTGIKLSKMLLRLLCRIGLHDFQIVEVTAGFGESGTVVTEVCRRCGVTVRHPK